MSNWNWTKIIKTLDDAYPKWNPKVPSYEFSALKRLTDRLGLPTELAKLVSIDYSHYRANKFDAAEAVKKMEARVAQLKSKLESKKEDTMKRSELKRMIREEILNELSIGDRISHSIAAIDNDVTDLMDDMQTSMDIAADAQSLPPLIKQLAKIRVEIAGFRALLKKTKL